MVPVLARQADRLAGDADILNAAGVADRPGPTAPLLPPRPGRRVVGSCGTGWPGQGPYPPPLDAVEKVLSVARQERRATETPGGQRVSRSRGG